MHYDTENTKMINLCVFRYFLWECREKGTFAKLCIDFM